MDSTPIIDPAIAAIAPDFRAVSLFADAHGVAANALDPAVLADACNVARAGGPVWAEAHLASWADAYGRFGARPNRTPCSAQALRKRVLKDGILPAINPVVDLYNAVSLRFAIPVGGEDAAAYVGPPRLTIANGTEPFDTIMRRQRRHLPTLELAARIAHPARCAYRPYVVRTGKSRDDAGERAR